MKPIIFTLATFTLALTTSAFAQQETDNPQQTASVPDEIIVTATKQTDPAMSAFLAGDYETAEIEFDKNAFCALRVQRNFEAARDSARESSVRSEVGGSIELSQQTAGGNGNTGAAIAASQNTPQFNPTTESGFERSRSEKTRTCENRGFQIYMKGLSQLELGKRAEAKATLSQATKIHRTLYDAHFKISLLEYQEGNIEKAKKELNKLKKISAKCRKCVAKPEIEGQVEYLDKLLNQ